MSSNRKGGALTMRPLRSGMWTREEMVYVDALVTEFKDGALDIPPGTTLRRFLAERVHCGPKRISKKYEGTGMNGRLSYAAQSYSSDETKARKIRLEILREHFLESVDRLEFPGQYQPPIQQHQAPQLNPAGPSSLSAATQIAVNPSVPAWPRQGLDGMASALLLHGTSSNVGSQASVSQASLAAAAQSISAAAVSSALSNPVGGSGLLLQDALMTREALLRRQIQASRVSSSPAASLLSSIGTATATDRLPAPVSFAAAAARPPVTGNLLTGGSLPPSLSGASAAHRLGLLPQETGSDAASIQAMGAALASAARNDEALLRTVIGNTQSGAPLVGLPPALAAPPSTSTEHGVSTDQQTAEALKRTLEAAMARQNLQQQQQPPHDEPSSKRPRFL